MLYRFSDSWQNEATFSRQPITLFKGGSDGADKRYERVQIGIEGSRVPYPEQMAVLDSAPQFGKEHKEYMRDVCDPNKMTASRREIMRSAKSVMELVRPRAVHGWINEWGEQIYAGNSPAILKMAEEGRQAIYEIFKKMGAKEIRGMDKKIHIGHLATYVGSCIVGTDPRRSVVNPFFESHDIDGLFICDGSVVPRSASQGYGGTVATVALFASSRITERHFKR